MFRSLLICLLLFTCSAHAAGELEALETAAEQGDTEAQYKLGALYDYGKGVPEDDAKAVYWYRKAAEQGSVAGQHYLGLMYAKGEGIPEDHVQAYAWFSVAAAQGYDHAQKSKESIAKDMTSAGIAEAQKLSRIYWESYEAY